MDTVQECTITAMPGTPANNVNVDNVASAAAGPNSGTAGRPSAREIEGGSALAHPFITPYKSHLPSHLFQGSAAKYSGASTPGAASSYGVESPLLSGDEESLDDGDESLGIRARREDSLGGLSFAYSSENSSPSTGRERSVEDSSPASGKREETPFPKDDSESIEESENAGLVHKSDEAIGAAPVSTSRAVKVSTGSYPAQVDLLADKSHGDLTVTSAALEIRRDSETASTQASGTESCSTGQHRRSVRRKYEPQSRHSRQRCQ